MLSYPVIACDVSGAASSISQYNYVIFVNVSFRDISFYFFCQCFANLTEDQNRLKCLSETRIPGHHPSPPESQSPRERDTVSISNRAASA